MRLARGKVVQFLGVPPEVEARASPAERQRVSEIIKSILPLSMRIEGIRNEGAIALGPLPLERVTTPTLVISAKDDLYNTLPAAEHMGAHICGAKLFVLDSGGHLMVGRGPEVDGAIADFLESVGTSDSKISALRRSGRG
jgi:pimeloyl-ACP methyl ester carboxylesterase